MNKPEQDGAATPGDLIVIGSSAGGIEALSIVVSSLPADFTAPIVLAQHLDVSRPSLLGPILERRSALPIVIADGTHPLQRGTIYVVPSNRHVIITDGSISLQGDHQGRPRPSIDWLFATAATAYGERLIAVILTGSGTDGAAGAVEVKNAGGTVIIQDPQTARFPSMPLALPPTVVDHVVKLDELGGLLTSLQQGLAATEGQADDSVRRILEQVDHRSNIDFRPYKASTIRRRIAGRAAITRSPTLERYADYLEHHPEEIGELVMAFLIKVTEFLRDREAFDYLRNELLPELIERGRERGRVLRFWSAGCATGEEPYSLAMVLADLLGSELPAWSIKIFATDLDENAISFARRGLYPSSVLKSLPETFQSRFFEVTSQGHHVIKALRQLVIFGQQDLSRGVPFPRIDLLLCRNLLIYFNAELQQRVVDIFAYSVPPGGYLFLGPAEATRPARDNFELVHKKWRIYRSAKTPLQLLKPQAPGADASSLVRARGAAPGEGSAVQREASASQGSEPEVEQLRRLNETVLRLLPVGVVIIDRAYRVLTISGLARRLLNTHKVAPGEDFLHATRDLPYERLRVAIDTAFSQRTPVTLPELEQSAGGASERRYISLSVMTVQREGDTPNLAVVSVLDSTDTVQTRRRLEAAQSEQQHLVGELSSANKRLGEMNKELQDTNEELQAANEELMVAQEELQATNEEFEATNEELQATNEELETNNEELQATNEELEITNEELEARSGELQELAQTLNLERARLSEMVELAPFFIMVLRGPSLVVEAVNRRYLKLFSEVDPVGLPFDEALSTDGSLTLLELIREAAQADAPRTTPRLPIHVQGEAAARLFAYTIVPLHDTAGKPDGVVVYGEDASPQVQRETELREAAEQLAARKELERLDHLKDEFLALASHELRTPLVPLVVYSDLLDKLIIKAQHACPTLDPRLGEFVGKFRKQLRHLERLTDDLLDVARLQKGRFSLKAEPVDLAPLLAQAVEKAAYFSDQPPIALLGPDGQPPPDLVVQGDEQRLLQVVLNVLRNALNYAASSDRIEVRLTQEQAAADTAAQAGARALARIDIQDHGPGIEPLAQVALFTRFYQESPERPRSKSGLGLGLYIARSIIEQHGGTIEVCSAVGEGSTFTIRLPLAELVAGTRCHGEGPVGREDGGGCDG